MTLETYEHDPIKRQEVARIAMQDAENPVIQGLQSILLKYGRHLETCWSRVSKQKCDCGWDEWQRDLEVIVDDE